MTNGVVYAETIRPLLQLLPGLLSSLDNPPVKTIIVDHLPAELVVVPEGLEGKVQGWEALKEDGGDGDVEFLRMGFDEPIWILFSSGTTGEFHNDILLEEPDSLTQFRQTKSYCTSPRRDVD